MIAHQQKILVMGSCFAEHIGSLLKVYKFDALVNPYGILYHPLAIAAALEELVLGKVYTEADLIQHEGIWHSMQHHGRFSGLGADEVAANINEEAKKGHELISTAEWLVITLGSNYLYRMNGKPVANCHKLPASKFEKELTESATLLARYHSLITTLRSVNPKLKILFTVSPVRYIRDGIVENNRSKARLLELAHTLCEKFEHIYYFPSYELVIDVLRDYRFYDADMAHPNEQAVEFVWEHAKKILFSKETQQLISQLKELLNAMGHRPFLIETSAHQAFRNKMFEKSKTLKAQYPFLNLEGEMEFFQ
jgi:hypothetical protein